MSDSDIDGFKGFWYLLKVLVAGETPKPDAFLIRDLEKQARRDRSLERKVKQLKQIKERIDYYNHKSMLAKDLWEQFDDAWRVVELEQAGNALLASIQLKEDQEKEGGREKKK
ncbi:hypothetical protein [Synechococcus sp. W4D4]|uniref:hypothetical protein n=1 Tax=Synechococcus sp. W4D4 TaxID=3392294 RepID=UPI0039E8A09B